MANQPDARTVYEGLSTRDLVLMRRAFIADLEGATREITVDFVMARLSLIESVLIDRERTVPGTLRAAAEYSQ